jgi:DNA (cytosine-5)-methyltransferase 1
VDTTQTTHISLCAGYGGIDLGLKRAIPNLRTVAFSEIEAFACANLVSKMEAGLLDPAPVWTNLKTFPWESFRGNVDILSGGYPCQPFSSAGKRLGKDDPRHLWPYIADGIRILQPALCFFENVEGHITLGLRDVLDDLGRLGYRTTWGIFSASEVGAPHQRKRVFILAHRSGAGLPRHWGLEHVGLSEGRQTEEGCAAEGGKLGSAGILWPSRPGQPQFRWEPPRVVGDAQHAGSQGQWHNATPEHRADSGLQFGAANGNDFDARQTESALGRNADGSAGGMDYAQLCVSGDNRIDELRLLGNGVVPATATRAFLSLIKEL